MSLLESEIREQPEALARLLDRQRAQAGEIAAMLIREDVKYVMIASRGSSSNAARYAQYVLGAGNRAPVMFATPSLYTLYGQPPRLDGAIVIGISQSGASPDIAAVLAEARRQGRPTIAMTNEPDSPLAQHADVVMSLEAGSERAIAATKTYLNSLGAVALLRAALDGPVAQRELERMPELLAEQIELSLGLTPDFRGYRHAVGATVIGRGFNYGTAFEIALKVRELSGLVVEAYSPADLMHGPIAAIQEGWPTVLVAPEGLSRESVREALGPLLERGAQILAISEANGASSDHIQTTLPLVTGVSEWLSAMTSVIPGQAMAMSLARLRGMDVDSPIGLQKVTHTL
jgi:glucosamine--fructose-6-phosphate aminotransferase (isomerizing)